MAQNARKNGVESSLTSYHNTAVDVPNIEYTDPASCGMTGISSNVMLKVIIWWQLCSYGDNGVVMGTNLLLWW